MRAWQRPHVLGTSSACTTEEATHPQVPGEHDDRWLDLSWLTTSPLPAAAVHRNSSAHLGTLERSGTPTSWRHDCPGETQVKIV
jgi:hypothetical protein